VAELLEMLGGLSELATIAGTAAEADGRDAARALSSTLEALRLAVSREGALVTALEDFLRQVAPTPAFAEEPRHG
jgi:hypothetical protein